MLRWVTMLVVGAFIGGALFATAQGAGGGPPIVPPGLTEASAGNAFLRLDASNDPITAELETSAGTFSSTTADGTAGFIFDVANAHATGNLFTFSEQGVGHVTIAANGNFSGGIVQVRNYAENATSTSGCATSGNEFCVNDDLLIDGHLEVDGGGTDPVLSLCGTTPTIVGSDSAGKVTIGTGVTTSCTVTFATAFANAPACTVSGDTAATSYNATTSTTVMTIISSADMDSDVVSYICVGI